MRRYLNYKHLIKFISFAVLLICCSAFVSGRELGEENILVSDVVINATGVDDILELVREDNILYIPLGETISLLGLEFKYSLNPFDLARQLDAQGFKFKADEIGVMRGNTYLSQKLMEEVLKASITFDDATQTVTFKSINKPFPIEEKWARRAREEAFDAMSKYSAKDDSRLIGGDQKFQLPFVDFSTGYFYKRDEEKNSSDYFGSSVHAFGITGSWDSDFYYYNMNNVAPESITLKTSKYSPDGNILGIFREAEVGDIYTTTSPASDGIINGYGVSFSTYADDYIYEKQLNIRDVLPSGWEVELYRNGELLGYQRYSLTGYYEFQDIPLFPGENKFTLIFYGPQGQVRRQERVLYYAGNLLGKGELGLRAYAVNKNKNILDTGIKYPSAFTGFSALAAAAYGVTERITVDAAVVQEPVTMYTQNSVYKENKTFASAGLSFMLHPVYVNLESLYDIKENAASADVSLISSIAGFSLNVENKYFGDTLTARNIRYDRILKNTVKAEVRKSLKLYDKFELPFTFGFQNDIDKENEQQNDFYFSVYKALWASLYTGIGYKNTDSFYNQRDEYITFYLSKFISGHSLRIDGEHNLNYGKISHLAASVQIYISKNIDANLRYDRNINDFVRSTYRNLYSGGFNLKTKIGYFNIDAGYASDKTVYVSAGYSLSFGFDTKTDKFIYTPEKLYNTGMIAASAYKDTNNNGKLDEGEERLEPSAFSVKPDVYGDEVYYSKDGYKYFPNLRKYYPYQVSLDTNDIDEGFSLLDKNDRKMMYVRPGEIVHLDYPLQESAFIDGSVYFEDKASRKKAPFNGLRLNLIDVSSGETVGTTLSEYDGFYSFDKVPLGSYKVVPDYKAMSALNYGFKGCQALKLETPEAVYKCPYTIFEGKKK